jgi:hemoglobin
MVPATGGAPEWSRQRRALTYGKGHVKMTSTDSQVQSLYQRLGGYDAIAAATDDLLGRLQTDPQLKDFWKGASLDNRRRARQLIVDYMVEAAGGPAFYGGRDMRRAHEGMRIDDEDWAVFTRHAAATLDHFAVPEREREEVLSFFASLKEDVVEVRASITA